MSSAKFYILKLCSQVDHSCKLRIKEILILCLVELQNWFFSTQMLDHLFTNLKKVFEKWNYIYLRHHVFNIIKRRSCQTLPNALKVSKKTPLTSTVGFLLSTICISCIIYDSSTIYEFLVLEENLIGKV